MDCFYPFVHEESNVFYFYPFMQASDSSFVKRSAASMLSGKKPVNTAVSTIDVEVLQALIQDI